ncbi:MAG: uracil-DNA glycosylase family protein [Erythrobacter sp.]
MSMPDQTFAQTAPLEEDFAAANQWWADAGVDVDFADDATDWLAAKEVIEAKATPSKAATSPAQAKAAEEAEKKPEILSILPETGAPADLAAFRKWWLEDPAVDAMGPKGRLEPRGDVGAKLMVLVLDPEAEDSDTLLSGPRGLLLDKILKASGIDVGQVYFASALPRHTPMADGADQATKGYAEVLHLHIKLAQPAHILALGSHILTLLQHGMAGETQKEAGSLHEINHEDRRTPVFVAESLEGLMGSPSLKARFWRRWIKYTERLD